MAFNNWNLDECTGDGTTKDLLGQGGAGYEVVVTSVWVSNNSSGAAVVTLFLTDSTDAVYFSIKKTLNAGESALMNESGGALGLICLNNQDKVKVSSDQADVSVLVSKDETYAG